MFVGRVRLYNRPMNDLPHQLHRSRCEPNQHVSRPDGFRMDAHYADIAMGSRAETDSSTRPPESVYQARIRKPLQESRLLDMLRHLRAVPFRSVDVLLVVPPPDLRVHHDAAVLDGELEGGAAVAGGFAQGNGDL